jgi:beta-1,4-mannosyltransferase
MRKYLVEGYRLSNVVVLRDRAPTRYSPIDRPTQDKFLERLPETKGIDRSKTKILVTSTSYTADEPLYPLLAALLRYAETPTPNLPNLPNLLLLITGRGPMQNKYRASIVSSSLSIPNSKCRVKMVWLEPDDYPLLLACADLGISVHTSSSGMDFPMKIIDLFGCGVPVCAMDFPAYLSRGGGLM